MSINYFERFVPYVHKLGDNQAAIENLVGAYQQEWDIIRDEINALPDLVDVDVCAKDYLAYLANHVGLDIEQCDDEALIRQQVRNIVDLYKYKGTTQGYEGLLRNLGYDTTVTILYEETPDGATTKEEDEVITAFNTRLAGWYCSSRILITLERLEAEDLNICGFSGGLLSPYLLQRIEEKIQSFTPIHIEFSLNFIFNFDDSLTMTDELAMDLQFFELLLNNCCCYHGKGALPIDVTFFTWDSSNAWDTDYSTEADNWDGVETINQYTPSWDRNNIFWDVGAPTWQWDPYSPEIHNDHCVRDETNAFWLTRLGYLKVTRSDLVIDGTTTITSASSLFSYRGLEIDDFIAIDIGEQYYFELETLFDEVTLTGTFGDNSEDANVSMQAYTCLYIEYTKGDENSLQIQVAIKNQSRLGYYGYSAFDYNTNYNLRIVTFNISSSGNYRLPFELENYERVLQVEIKAENLGSSPGTCTINYNIKYLKNRYQFLKIDTILSETQIQLESIPDCVNGTYAFETYYIRNYHKYTARHNTSYNSSVPEYLRDVMYNYNTKWDLGLIWDDASTFWDDIGKTRNCCKAYTNVEDIVNGTGGVEAAKNFSRIGDDKFSGVNLLI